MKKTFIVLVIAFVLSLASSAWGIYLEFSLPNGQDFIVGEEYPKSGGDISHRSIAIFANGYESLRYPYTIDYSVQGALPTGMTLSKYSPTVQSMAVIYGTPERQVNIILQLLQLQEIHRDLMIMRQCLVQSQFWKLIPANRQKTPRTTPKRITMKRQVIMELRTITAVGLVVLEAVAAVKQA